jgi:hypothetical protein
MSNSTPAKFPVGSKVVVDHPKYPGIWTVQSNGPVNATLSPENGGRGLRVPHTMLAAPTTVTASGAVVTTIPLAPPVEFFSEGGFVRIATGKYAGVWVVIRDNGSDKVNVAKIGGDNGKYLRVARRSLTGIDIATAIDEM